MTTDLQNVQTSEVVLTQKRYLSDATIADIPAYTATGSAVEPSLIVDYFGTTLVKDTDYTATYSNNTTPGTATVTLTGIGDCVGTLSATYEVVELTPPSAENVPANATGHSINGTYSLSGYDASKDYSVVISLEGTSGGATFSVVTTTGLSFPGMAFPTDLTDVTEAYFYGSPSDIENALNSITYSTTNVAFGEIKMHVYIYSYVANTVFNPGNGHVYNVVSDQSISWSNALSTSSSTSFGGSTGYMVTVTSQDEQDFFYRLDKSVWLGLSDEESEGTFKWVTGPESGTVVRTPSGNVDGVFEKWASGQPNNYLGNEHYVGFYRPAGSDYGWRDYSQTSNEIYGYVTEYGTSTSGLGTDVQSVQTSLVVLTQNKYLADATIAEIPAYTATGSAVEPSLIIDYFGTTLVKDTDYTVVFTDNVSAGTASVSVSGIGDYVGTISSTFEVVELTSPTNQNVPVNTQNWDLSGQFNLSGYDSTKTYKAAVIVEGDPDSSFSVTQTSGITFDFGYDDWTEVRGVNFKGTAENLQSALNSVQINTSTNNEEIKLRVFLTSQIENTFLNPANGHIYEFVPGQITWTDANLASSSLNYESEPGYITTLTSEIEDNFVSNYVQAQNFWIGLSDATNEGEWYWITGPEAGTLVWSASNSNETGYTGIINGQWCNWVTNDPNNANYNTGTGQDYAVAKFEGNVEWNDVNNGDTRVDGYVIEYGDWSDAMDLTFYSTQKAEIILTKISQGVTIQSSDTTTSEGGDEASFTVVLDINPIDDVTIPINSSDVSEGTIIVDELVFTPSNWEVPQMVVVTGIGDELLDGDISYLIETGNPVSNDSNYDALLASDISDLTFTNQDNDIDSDGDGISDAQEGYNSTDPDLSTDTDGDGVPDYLEDNTAGDHTNPNNDSDGDGESNAYETANGTDPNNASSNSGVLTWIGTTSGDWSTTSNWSSGAAPTSSTVVVIDGTFTNEPIISSTTDVTILSVTIANGNTLTIDETSSLTVSGDFTNDGTVTLNSTADDFSSLIVEGTATGDITYNRYVNAYNTDGGWDFVGSPTAMTIEEFTTANAGDLQTLGDDFAFASYNNAVGQWQLYPTVSPTGSFTAGQGYAMATAAGSTVAFTGTMKTADQSINIINNNGLNDVGRRWNLVSNPYPSYINGNTAAGASNFILANTDVIDDDFGAVYGWNGSSYDIYNLLDGAFSIAPGQAFWVAALNTTTTALNFTADMRTTTGTGDFVAGPQPLTYHVALELYNGETQKATTDFYFRDGLSLGIDPWYDAGAFNQSTKLSSRLAQGSQETAFARNAMGMDAMQNTRVPLEIRQNAGQTFTISIADMNLPEDIYVYLEDTLNGTLTSLKDQDFELVAQSDLSGLDRFFIVFKSNAVLSNGDTLGIDALNAYKANNDSFVTIAGIAPELGQLDVTLYNIIGQTVTEKSFNPNTATQRVSTQGLASGLYMIQIKSGNHTTVKKIIIK